MELPRLKGIYDKYKDAGFSVIVSNSYPEVDGALEFFAEHNLEYPHLKDAGKKYMGEELGLYGHPYSVLLDENHKVVGLELGFTEGDEVKLEQLVKILLGCP